MAELFPSLDVLGYILLRTGAVYLLVLIGLRLAGKREIGQMTVFDLVVLLLLANAVQNAMVGGDASLGGGLAAAGLLLLLNGLISRATLRWPRLRRTLVGSPTLLVLHGEILADHLRREGVSQEELETALREHGVASVDSADMAVLEVDGSISVVPTEQPMKRGRRRVRALRHS
jgi:uncharacterized membrane protein YcaP (DUF421 family)